MKVRHGFVSNSSSSSFVCAVCGEIESGYDLSLSDCEMSRCEHGHEFHNSHAELDFFEDGTREEKYELLKKSGYTYDTVQLEKDFVELTDEEFDDKYEQVLMDSVVDFGVPEKYCPACQKIAEYLKDPEYQEYLRLKQKFNGICE